MEPITQEDGFGCGVACVAAALGITYQEALSFFGAEGSKAVAIGYSARELATVLRKGGLSTQDYLPGTIVFLRRSAKYRFGHYLVWVEDQWMDPWVNFPQPKVRAGFRKRLPGTIQYLLYPIEFKSLEV